jgi:hypothetical protein
MSLEVVVFSPSTMEKKENKKTSKEGRERSAEQKNWKGKVISDPRGAGI